MKILKSIILVAALFLTASFSPGAQSTAKVAKQTSPDALVAELYRQSGRNRSPFFQTRSRALVGRYFEKRLADLIWKDAIRSKGEVGAIDGDPLYNAQDMEIKHFVVHKPTFANGAAGGLHAGSPHGVVAEVKVSFENFGKKEEIVFLLSSSNRAAGWKIANIKYNDGTDLLEILKGGD
jgi:hypothetical protein